MSSDRLRFYTNVDFHRALEVHDEFLLPLARIVGLLRDFGIEFSRTTGDFLLADSDLPLPSNEQPFVLFDRSDGAFLWWRFQPCGQMTRAILESPRMLGLIKISRYSSRDFYNREVTDSSHHARRIRESQAVGSIAGDDNVVPPISMAAYDRLRLGAGYWAFDQCGRLATMPGIANSRRPIDVFCAHSVNYSCPAISWHRQAAFEQLSRMRGIKTVVGRGRVFLDQHYRELLLRSRICISPWGWGETCIRDYEALLAGCVLIKPRTDFIHSALPLDERHYVACRPDFSDLPERISEVLENRKMFSDRAPQLREYVLRARDPRQVAADYAAALRASVAETSSIAESQSADAELVPGRVP